jgi:hypothetical protein
VCPELQSVSSTPLPFPAADGEDAGQPAFIPAPPALSGELVERNLRRMGLRPPTKMADTAALAARLLWLDNRRGGGRHTTHHPHPPQASD